MRICCIPKLQVGVSDVEVADVGVDEFEARALEVRIHQ